MSDKLIVFSQEKISLSDQYSTAFQIHYFDDVSGWKKENIAPSAILIAGHSEYTATLLNSIRRDDDLYLSLCFVSDSIPSININLTDGQLPPPQQLKSAIDHYDDLLNAYKNSETHVSELGRLVKYLWLRPNFTLLPTHEWHYPRYYRYPLLDALSRDKFGSFEWLQSLANTNLLEPTGLIDRQRECKFCHSSHLSFIDVCPNCQSLDIKLQPSIHCFTCGNVDIQDKFFQSGVLMCPKCTTQLRHIGSDYDRPIENHHCLSCSYTFVESDVTVRCAMCEKEMAPEELTENKIQGWRLSERGRIIAIRGEVFDIASSFNQLNFISKDLFVHDLNWLLISSRRYRDITFSIFGIYFANLPELSHLFGHTKLLQMLESFAQRIRTMLRTPDLSTRTAENMLWLLLPQTDGPGIKVVHQRIENNVKLLLEDSDRKLDCRFISATSSQLSSQENAELLLARLQGELA